MYKKIITVLTSFYVFSFSILAQTPHTHHHGFANAEQWSQVFDNPERDKWQKPHEVIQALNLKSDAIIADIGSGTGYFAIRLAHMVPKGTVYGVDSEPDMVKFLNDRATKLNINNLISLKSEEGSPLLPKKIDLALFVDVFHHIGNRIAYLKKLRSSLNLYGRIAIIDFNKASPMGPPINERISADQVKSEFQNAGFKLVQEFNFLPYQYFLVFE